MVPYYHGTCSLGGYLKKVSTCEGGILTLGGAYFGHRRGNFGQTHGYRQQEARYAIGRFFYFYFMVYKTTGRFKSIYSIFKEPLGIIIN